MGYPPEERLPMLEAVWTQIPVGIALYSAAHGRFMDANPAMLSMLGYSGAELTGCPAADLLHPEERAMFAPERLQTFMNRIPCPQEDWGELQFVHKSGQSVWVQVRVLSVLEKGQSVLFMIKDVSLEREQRKSNQNNEALAQLMTNSKHDMISFTTPEGILTYISPSCKELLGYEPEEMIGKSRFEFYHPDEFKNITPEEFYSGGDVKQRRLRHKQGNYLWFEISFQRMFDERGNMELMLGMGRDITYRKNVEHILAEAQRIAHIGSWDWHIAEGKLYFSEEARRIFGYALDQVEDEKLEHLYSVMPPEDRERLRECMRETAATGMPREITYRIYLPSRELRVIHAQWEMTWQHDGKPHRCIGYAQDITGKVEMERMLRESEQRYRSLFEYNPFCVFQMDLTGRMLTANPHVESLTGWSVSDIQDHSFLKIIHPREINRIKKQFVRVREGNACTTECAILHKNGSWIDLNLTLLPIIVENKVAGVYGIANDITEQKRYVEQIEKLNDERTLLLNAVSEGIAGLDANGDMTFINPAGAKIFGFEPGEEKEALRQISLLNVHGPDGSVFPEGHTPIERALRDGIPRRNQEGVFWRRDGSSFFASYQVSPLDREQARGVVVVFRDLTEEQEIIRAKESAERADQAKSEFLAIMSHELRTPMNGIIGMAELLAEMNLLQEQRELVEVIVGSGHSLLKIVNEILDFSKMEAGKLEIHMGPLSVPLILSDVAELFRRRGESKNLVIRTEIDPAIPDLLAGDEGRLRQILINLVGNAVKFTDSGSVFISVKLMHSDLDRAFLEFRVRDTGIGIPLDRQHQLFHSFCQLHPSINRKYGGTGLGLAISKKLVELMGGSIGVESDEGKGALFHFTLPLDYLKEHGVVQEAPPERAEAAMPVEELYGPLRLLVAEDNEANRMLLKIILGRLGYYPDWVEDGLEALQRIRQTPYDIVLLDIQMPRMDGLEVVSLIKRELLPWSMPVFIAITAFARQEDRAICLEAGMDDYVCKPIRRMDIEALLEKWSPVIKSHSFR